MNTKNIDIVVIGAGLTGLSCGAHLKQKGANFLILEKEAHVGGVIQTVCEDGFIFEKGPNTGVLAQPEIQELFEMCKEECQIETANPAAKKRLIWKEQQWHALPSGLISAITTPLFSFFDKLRILKEPWRKKGTNPMESVAHLVRRRLGKSFLNYAVDPFISGIYAGDPEKLITKYALPKLYNLEQDYGSFIKGAIKKKKEPRSNRMKKATREVFSATGGLGQFMKGLAKFIGKENIQTEANNIAILPTSRGFQINYNNNGTHHAFIAQKVITTSGATSLVKLLPFIKHEQLLPITNLKYAKIALGVLGYKKWDGININAFGGLAPSVEKRDVLGMLFTSSFFQNRAPKQGALITVFTGGARRPEVISMNDKELEKMILNEAKEMLQTDTLPDLVKLFRYETAIPQYDASTENRLEAIKGIEKEFPGLILAGNIRDGIAMADRAKQGREVAELAMNKYTHSPKSN